MAAPEERPSLATQDHASYGTPQTIEHALEAWKHALHASLGTKKRSGFSVMHSAAAETLGSKKRRPRVRFSGRAVRSSRSSCSSLTVAKLMSCPKKGCVRIAAQLTRAEA